MIVEGTLPAEKRAEFSGKPYTFDLDRDFLRLTIYDRPIAFSDYFPRPAAPNDYIILDFDKEGRVVGIALEGLLREWATRSIENRAKSIWMRTRMSAKSVSLASKVIAELSARAFFDSLPQFDSAGRLPAYAV